MVLMIELELGKGGWIVTVRKVNQSRTKLALKKVINKLQHVFIFHFKMIR